jgi:hypothetical protein
MRAVAYSHNTRHGTFWVAIQDDRRWHVVFDGDSLGGYDDPHSAAYELANGLTYWPSFGDPTALGIPEELDDWTPHASP